MKIHSIGKRNLVIYFSNDELSELPAPPADLQTNDAAEIFREVIEGSGEDLSCDSTEWNNVYLELFAGRDSLLLVARAHSGDPRFFEFHNIEDLISAAMLCPTDIISFLSYSEGSYFLIVYPWDSESPPDVLHEFGEEVSLHPNFAFHLTEHGKILMGPSAIDELHDYFQ